MQSTLALLLPGISLEQYAEIFGLIFVASLMQGIGGIGLAIIAAPISLLLYPQLVPGPILVLGAAIATMGALREFREIQWRPVGTLFGGRIAGSLAAAAVLLVLPADPLAIVFALLILAGVGFSFRGWKLEATRLNLFLAGTMSGLMGTITSSGAPPMALALQHYQPPQMRATISCVFVIGALFSIAVLRSIGMFGLAELQTALALLPAMVAGFVVSNPIKRRVSHRYIRTGLLVLSSAGAIGILIRTFAGA